MPHGHDVQSALGPSVPGLAEVDPPRDEFARVVSYRFYRLNHTNATYDARASQKMKQQVRALRHAILPGRHFTGKGQIQVLAFLKLFRYSADHIGVAEGPAARLLPCFLE